MNDGDMERQFVTHHEFEQFRSDVAGNFDRIGTDFNRVFAKFDELGDRIARKGEKTWPVVASFVTALIGVVVVALAGYIAHVTAEDPHRVAPALEAEIKAQAEISKLRDEFIQKQIDQMTSNHSRR